MSRGIASLFIVLLVLLCAGTGCTSAVATVEVDSRAMEPTLREGDTVTVDPVHGQRLNRGDIIAFYHPLIDDVWVRRVVGLPGEEVEVEASGYVLIDGNRLDEPYMVAGSGVPFGPARVPSFHYFVLGDSRGLSEDSRGSLGPVPFGNVKGIILD